MTRRHGLLLTSPARTIHDLAPSIAPAELERVVAEAGAHHLVDLDTLRASARSLKLRAVLDAGPRWTRSHTERVFLDLVRRAGLPRPATNVPLAGLEVDALWREQRVAVEIDSWQFHGDRRAFERDRARDRALREAGFTPVRFTAQQLARTPERVVAHLARLLAVAE